MLADETVREKRQAVQEAVAAGSARMALGCVKELLSLGRSTDIAFCATALKKMSTALLEQGHRQLKAFVVRSVTVEPILPALQVEAALGGYLLDVEIGGYGSYMQELMDPTAALGRAAADLVFVLLETEDLAGELQQLCAGGSADQVAREVEASADRVAQMLESYRANSRGRLVVQGCVLPEATSLGFVGDANLRTSFVNALRALNQQLAERCRSLADCAFYDVDEVAARYGRERWRDERMFLASRLNVAPGAFRSYAHGLMRTASALFRAPRKVLCTDLDNTLWGGILGEDGVAGIATGHAFPGNCFFAYQQYLKELNARGILLAVTSKNNESDVADAFRARAADLAVTLDDFVARKISWSEKTQALRELSAELSLGLDSFVFVDDNPAECEAVRQHLPEVAVIEVPVSEPWRLVKMLSDAWFFDVAVVTADDRNRSEEYRAQAQRSTLENSAGSREDFLASLGMVCTFLGAADAPLERSVQLLAKTNQFNLTTRRHSASEVMQFVSDPGCQAVAVRVRDRFGDAGVVGLAFTRETGDECWIDTLLLSCRVIGRGIETAILAQLAAHAAQRGMRWLVGEYLPTKKNVPCEDFYAEHGFTRELANAGDGAVRYRFDLAESLPKSPVWLTLEGTEINELAANSAVPA